MATAIDIHPFDSNLIDGNANATTTTTAINEGLGYTYMDEYLAYEKGYLLHNKYKFVKTLQTGSFGQVSLAIDINTNTHVAIKTMCYHNQQQHKNNDITQMFTNEVKIMQQINRTNSRNAVKLIESFNTQKFHILVMEYCDDGDLYDKIINCLNNGYNDNNDILLYQSHVIRELISSVRSLHANNIYHRDIKPENVLLLQTTGEVKLSDFGLSTTKLHPNDLDVGTEKYIAPEVITTKRYDANKADYWSLGITIAFLLFGRCPFKKALFGKDINFDQFNKDPKKWLSLYYEDNHNLCTDSILDSLLKLLVVDPSKRDLDAFESSMLTGLQEIHQLNISQSNNNNNTVAVSSAAPAVFQMDDQIDDEMDICLDLDESIFNNTSDKSSSPEYNQSQGLEIPGGCHHHHNQGQGQDQDQGQGSASFWDDAPPTLTYTQTPFSWADEVDDDNFDFKFDFNNTLLPTNNNTTTKMI